MSFRPTARFLALSLLSAAPFASLAHAQVAADDATAGTNVRTSGLQTASRSESARLMLPWPLPPGWRVADFGARGPR